jgi:putative oxidoreductase
MDARITPDWILLFVRVVTGVVLMYYGLPKCRALRSCARDFEGMGFRPGLLWGTLIAIIELFGGLAMLAGAYAELAASLFGFQMIVGTFWKLKTGKDFTDYSYDLQLLALCVVLMTFGAGIYAPARFDATVFLRWWAIPIIVFAGAMFAYLSKPQIAPAGASGSGE